LPNVAPRSAFRVSPVEIVCAEFLVRNTVAAHDVVRDLKHLVADGDDRFLMPAMTFDQMMADLQSGVLFRVAASALLDQGGAEIATENGSCRRRFQPR
jgi:hypothetical protein